ncbi:innexin inx7-like [Vespa velutina]|uniref:innexin inx7-like n=1 Tax=Vespa velutina TaxID=202808 RepID=UPI001FB4BD98|nr:innexin inx7-like [Vespa velutina]
MAATFLSTFSVLKDHVKLKVAEDSAAIDNIVFRLHYRVTFLALLVGSLLVSARQYIGEHIRCIADSSINPHVIETYCFFTSTFTVVKHMNASYVNEGEIPHPGVGPIGKNDETVHHAYYQWVPFVLFFQALLFYLPHYIWRKTEGGRLKNLVSGLHVACLGLHETAMKVNDKYQVPSKDDVDQKIQKIRKAFIERIYINRTWSYYLTFCEILNFINVVTQIYLTNWFLGGAFMNLGKIIGDKSYSGRMEPLDIVFPKVTKCTFHKYGSSGTIQTHDALCVMALNIINEKIYTFLWYWFIILSFITLLGLIWRLITMVLHARSEAFNKILFSMACPGKYNPWNVVRVTREYHFGDWLFLYYIAKNLDNYVFKDLLERLAQDLENINQGQYYKTTYLDVEEYPLQEKSKTLDIETSS